MDDDWFYGGVWKWQIDESDANFVAKRYERTIDRLWPSLTRARFDRSPAAYRDRICSCSAAMIASNRSSELLPLLSRFVDALARKGLADTYTVSLLGLTQILSGNVLEGKQTWHRCCHATYVYRSGYECPLLQLVMVATVEDKKIPSNASLAECCRKFGRDVEPLGFILAQVAQGKLAVATAIANVRREFENSESDLAEARWLVRFYAAISKCDKGKLSKRALISRLHSLGTEKLMTVPFEYVFARVSKQIEKVVRGEGHTQE